MSKIPFNEKELEVIGALSPVGFQFPPAPKFNTPVTPKENYMMMLEGKQPYWIPLTTDNQFFSPRLIVDNVVSGICIDGETPLITEDYSGTGFFGIEWEYIESAGGAMEKPGVRRLTDVCDWEKELVFPDLDALDWEASKKANEAWFERDDRLLEIRMLCGFWERLMSLVGVETAAMALIDDDEKECVKGLFDALCNFYDKLIDKYKTYYNPDIILMHDDWGTQRAPFFSPDTTREMLLPYMKQLVESCHKRGIKFELHSCGFNESNVSVMLESGVDIWTGQQMNDTKKLIEQYGDKMVFQVEAPIFMPGTPKEEIIKTAETFFETYKDCRTAFIVYFPDPTFHETIYKLSRAYYQ